MAAITPACETGLALGTAASVWLFWDFVWLNSGCCAPIAHLAIPWSGPDALRLLLIQLSQGREWVFRCFGGAVALICLRQIRVDRRLAGLHLSCLFEMGDRFIQAPGGKAELS